jgi:ABC-2 type transport system ATP-binding protein
MSVAEPAVEVSGLRKHFRGAGDEVGLNGIDLNVLAGSVCGLLGPNGAGKTTTVRILATLLRPDAGEVRVAGFDVRRQAADVRRSIGLVGQHAALDEVLTGRANLRLFGRLHHLGGAAAGRRADELLTRFGLEEAAGRPVSGYSGGMRRRLDLAAGLIVAPPVLLVDEPTTGLDPVGRQEVWSAVEDLVATGVTVLLTTQYLEEADRLADRITVLRTGRVAAEGTPAELKSTVGPDRLDITFRDPDGADRASRLLAEIAVAPGVSRPDVDRISVPVPDRGVAVSDAFAALRSAGIDTVDLTVRRPTLDEAFIALTRPEVAA